MNEQDKKKPGMPSEKLPFCDDIYAKLPIGIEIYDTDGILRHINDHALNVYGAERDAVVGSVNLFESPYLTDELLAKIHAREEISMEFEYDFKRMNNISYFKSRYNNTIIYEVHITAVWDKSGAIIAHMLLTKDVTEKKEAEFRTGEAKKNLEMAMDAANMTSWTYDVRKNVFTSLYGEAVFGKNTLTLRRVLEVLHPQDGAHLVELFTKLKNNQAEYGQITLRVSDGPNGDFRYYESRMRVSPEHFGKLLIVGTLLDVTEKLRMQKKTQDLISKRELAMEVSNIVHWDFDLRTRKFESYNDPINDFAPDRLLEISEFQDVIHPEDRSPFYDAIQAMIAAKNEKINFTCRVKTRHDDAWQYCNIIGIPFERDENGKIVRFTGFRQNISKLHRLNEEIKERNYKIELSFKTIGMSYWDFDVESGRFKAFNDPVSDFHSDKPIAPEDYLNVTHPDDAGLIMDNVVKMRRGTDAGFSFEYRSKTKWDREWQTMVVTGIPLEKDKKGRITRYTGIKINNTKWEKMARELKDLKDKAELSDRLKSAFLANMSHEIRTPLNAIVGFSELMAGSDNHAERAEYMDIINTNNSLLLSLINDILDFSKIEAGVIERKREKFGMAKLCSELHTMILPKIENPNVKFFIAGDLEDCTVFLDRNRLKQVWMNFTTNAVKCTRQGHIKIGYSIERGGVRIYVEDTGVGIPKELHGKVFARFQKLNRFAQGTGLGLAISKAIVEAAGGEVGFSSSEGVGSVFWAWVPCETYMWEDAVEAEAPEDESAAAACETKAKNLKILVAEDNDSNFLLMRHVLKGYNLERAENGAEAVNKVRDGDFDIVFMDMQMPVMEGLEATRKIREFDGAIPIVALTANAFDSDMADAINAGCTAFLSKPLKKDRLFEALAAHSRKRRP